MKRLLLNTAVVTAVLATGAFATGALTPRPVQAAESCNDGLGRLGQRIAGYEAADAQPIGLPATPLEIAQLRTLRQTAERTAQAGNDAACQAILAEADTLAGAIERPRVLAADDLEDAKLHAPNGDEMGAIDELVIDPATGRVAYAVVELGGFLGLGERSFPVPWALFQPARNGDGYVLNVPKERLTGAPQFTRSNRPDMSDRQWAMALHTYYGVPPYWLGDATALAASGAPVASGGGGSDTPQLRQEVQRLSQEVDRLTRELAQARTLADTTAQKPSAAPEPSAGASGGSPPPATQGGSAPPTPPPTDAPKP